MSSFTEIPIPRRKDLNPLFAKHKRVRPSADAVLEGRSGQGVANSDGGPRVSRLIAGPCMFFAAIRITPAAREMIAGLFGEKLILVDSPEWHAAGICPSGQSPGWIGTRDSYEQTSVEERKTYAE